MNDLIKTIQYIVSESTNLKNKYADVPTAPVEFACIFCENENECKEFTSSIEKLGNIVERTPKGFTYLLEKPIMTIAGSLRFVKIRKPDPNRIERGDRILIPTTKILRKNIAVIPSLN